MFKAASSPHTHSTDATAKIMLWVILALLPAVIVQNIFFGFGVFIQLILAISFALLLELVVTLLRNKPTLFYISDFSVVLTAAILAIAIPPYAPYWLILIGTFFAVVVAKHIYGGLGQNVFNPAMVGYVVLLISFPLQMTSWIPPQQILSDMLSVSDAFSLIFTNTTNEDHTLLTLVANVDGVTQATPLDNIKTETKNNKELADIFQHAIFSTHDQLGGIGWWQVNIAFLLGGIFLMYKKIIQWYIPIAFILVFFGLCTINWMVNPAIYSSPLLQLLNGATMFCAFFIATDPVTASITPKGKIIFALLVALLVYIIRYYGGYPDGVAFAILLANICVPLIDHYTRPRVYGATNHG